MASFAALSQAFLPKFNYFSFIVEQRCENKLLKQQSAALANLQEWFAPGSPWRNEIALVSMPTGSGKTGVVCCLPYFLGRIGLQKDSATGFPNGEPEYRFEKPVLVIAPSLDIANQLETQLLFSASGVGGGTFLLKKCIVPIEQQRNVLPNGIKIEQTSDLGKLDKIERQDVIIANAQKFRSSQWEQELNNDSFRLVVVDEAHHFPAQTWLRIINKFQGHALVVFFTATPYRGDGQPVLENTPIAYHLRLDDAVTGGIIRKTEFIELTGIHQLPDGISVRETNSPEDYEEIKRITMVLQAARLIQKKKDRFTPLPNQIPHMIIAIAKDIFKADVLLRIWQVIYPDFAAATYYSEMTKPAKEEVMRKLRNNELKLVVIVQMLLEGFDHPPISIAAITTKIVSPVKFTQFVGRAQRICRTSEGNEIGGIADIVTHSDYQQRENYNQFKEERLIPCN